MVESEDRHGPSSPEWLHKHVHEPNPEPPSGEPDIVLALPSQPERIITLDDLDALPQHEVRDCFIVSTGHGTSGPFRFGGVRLRDFVDAIAPADLEWQAMDVISVDGFGNRVLAEELAASSDERPMLLATHIDGRSLTRAQGLVRLIAPSETDDALRQVKWIGRIEFQA